MSDTETTPLLSLAQGPLSAQWDDPVGDISTETPPHEPGLADRQTAGGSILATARRLVAPAGRATADAVLVEPLAVPSAVGDDEQAPLAQTSARQALVKGCCWACWETTDTIADPLVRVCRGCKDRDLQWIHQYVHNVGRDPTPLSVSCVDRFISNLPHRTPPASFFGSIFSSTATTFGGPRQNSDPTSQAAGVVGRPQRYARIAGPNAPPPARPKFYCTRCKDPYTVVETPISPLVILSRDPFLLACMSTMSACVVLLTVCSVSILRAQLGPDAVAGCAQVGISSASALHGALAMGSSGPSLDGNPPARDDWKLHDQHARPPGPRVHGLPARIPQASPWRMGTPSYAATVLLACHLVHALTWRYVLSACSGRTVKHVVSIEGSKAVSSRAHRDQPGALYAVCAATAAVTVVAGCIDASDARHAAAACLADVHVRIHE